MNEIDQNPTPPAAYVSGNNPVDPGVSYSAGLWLKNISDLSVLLKH